MRQAYIDRVASFRDQRDAEFSEDLWGKLECNAFNIGQLGLEVAEKHVDETKPHYHFFRVSERLQECLAKGTLSEGFEAIVTYGAKNRRTGKIHAGHLFIRLWTNDQMMNNYKFISSFRGDYAQLANNTYKELDIGWTYASGGVSLIPESPKIARLRAAQKGTITDADWHDMP